MTSVVPSAAPLLDGDRVCLPERYWITLDRDTPAAKWIICDASERKLLVNEPSEVTGRLDVLTDDRGMVSRMARYGPVERLAARYSGFVIDAYYLRAHDDLAFADAAARLCRIFIHYWQRREVLGDPQGQRALPMLWRTYWRALDRIAEAEPEARERRMRGWASVGFAQEHGRALERWLQYAIDDAHVWFFADLLTPWVPGTQHWQVRREAEVAAVVWATPARHAHLRRTALTAPGGQRRIEALIEGWYLPHYDLQHARRLMALLEANAQPSQHLQRAATTLGRWVFTGAQRLYAAIAVAYAGTALQGDTWTTLAALARDGWRWIGTMTPLVLFTYGYLVWGIGRKTGVAAWPRAWALWWRGMLVALLVAALLTWGIAPIEFSDPSVNLTDSVPWLPLVWIGILMVVLYAQLALFFGIFVQLLFEDRPTTAPLDAP